MSYHIGNRTAHVIWYLMKVVDGQASGYLYGLSVSTSHPPVTNKDNFLPDTPIQSHPAYECTYDIIEYKALICWSLDWCRNILATHWRKLPSVERNVKIWGGRKSLPLPVRKKTQEPETQTFWLGPCHRNEKNEKAWPQQRYKGRCPTMPLLVQSRDSGILPTPADACTQCVMRRQEWIVRGNWGGETPSACFSSLFHSLPAACSVYKWWGSGCCLWGESGFNVPQRWHESIPFRMHMNQELNWWKAFMPETWYQLLVEHPVVWFERWILIAGHHVGSRICLPLEMWGTSPTEMIVPSKSEGN